MEKTTKRKMLQDHLNSVEDINLRKLLLEVLSIEKAALPKVDVLRSIRKIIEKKQDEN